MTPEERERIREWHAPQRHASGAWCKHDDQKWPCDSAVLLAEVERLRDALGDALVVIEGLYLAEQDGHAIAPSVKAAMRAASDKGLAALSPPPTP